MPSFSELEITGDISVRPVPANEQVPKLSLRYLIMGPTGAGKSTFVEALAGAAQSLQISKNQLAGYTQSVTAYQFMNVNIGGWPIYLVDSPGFSDTKISETEIMEMVQKWMVDNDTSYFNAMLFLTPINEPRLGGSKRRTIEMLKAFLKPADQLNTIIFVTTMWDQLHHERAQQRAESNFAQLQDEILKDFINAGARFEQFRNTRDSALHILVTAYLSSVDLQLTPESEASLYRDLHERIEGALHQKNVLQSELADPEAQADAALKSILEKNYRDNEETLTKFLGQFVRVEEPPAGFSDAHQRLRKAIDKMQNPSRAEDDPTSSDHHHPISHSENVEFSLALPELIEAAHGDVPPLRVITPNEPQHSPLGDPIPFSPSHLVVGHLPISSAQTHPTRRVVSKGLFRRLIQAAKRLGSKWFMTRKPKD